MRAGVPGAVSWDRMVGAVEKVKERLLRAAAALDSAGVPYAVIGGNAVAAWVSKVDESAVRNTRDVDILLRRSDLDAASRALSVARFVRRHAAGVDLFLDGPKGRARDAVHIVFAGEKVRPNYAHCAPDVVESDVGPGFRLVRLDALVRMKLTSYRLRDRVHLLDMVDVGLLSEDWKERLPADLAARLGEVLAEPER